MFREKWNVFQYPSWSSKCMLGLKALSISDERWRIPVINDKGEKKQRPYPVCSTPYTRDFYHLLSLFGSSSFYPLPAEHGRQWFTSAVKSFRLSRAGHGNELIYPRNVSENTETTSSSSIKLSLNF
ncbi:hypothetical protein EG68_07341 [Paragonimus skrjabini miyazakii]|uniref:Uncharacterized protein n=1 Tax=Paragonimus skrjabini miyazakii TaxID=59628 RepID=A0A8S9Z1R3_9TREM|nr:hypothetical protein EG68_07341 [Paragonimus skrjabini miyazakii]